MSKVDEGGGGWGESDSYNFLLFKASSVKIWGERILLSKFPHNDVTLSQ